MLVIYVFAFQFLATGIVATQMAAATASDALALCAGTSSDDGSDTGRVPHHSGHSICPVCAFASSVPPLPAAAMGFAYAVKVTASYSLTSPVGFVAVNRHDPRCSQGPPQAA